MPVAHHSGSHFHLELIGLIQHTRDALIRALSQIGVDTATTLEGLIHFLTTDRATCLVFSDDDIPYEGLIHICPLFIDVAYSGHRVLSVLLDNGSALNVCQLVTAIALGFYHPILGHPHRPLELMMGLRGQLWAHSAHMS